MTTARMTYDYDTGNMMNYDNQQYNNQPSNSNGIVTKKVKSGSYNVIEKDYGDHKRIYHVPIEYGDNYDLSQLDEPQIVNEPVKTSPRLVRRRIYHEYDTDAYRERTHVEEPAAVSTRRYYVSPKREQREREIVQRFYEPEPAPLKKVEYIYEDDNDNVYEYRPETSEPVEYYVREKPQTRYIEEVRPVQRVVYVDEPAVPQMSERPVSISPHPQATGPVRHSPMPTVSPPPAVRPHPVPIASISSRFNSMSPPPIHRPTVTARSVPNIQSPRANEVAPLRLMDVVAQNRARRGARAPKPRREVDEAKTYDPPTYNRNIIKNGFIVHK